VAHHPSLRLVVAFCKHYIEDEVPVKEE